MTVKQEKAIKGIQVKKGTNTTFPICRRCDFQHRKFRGFYKKKLLELISKFEVTGYNINTQQSIAFLYSNEHFCILMNMWKLKL